jgi:hypothetical protein
MVGPSWSIRERTESSKSSNEANREPPLTAARAFSTMVTLLRIGARMTTEKGLPGSLGEGRFSHSNSGGLIR